MRGVSVRSLLSSTLTAPVGTPGHDHWCDRRRGFRVLAIGATTIAMCAVDLYLTILFVTSVGLHEGNPIARAVMLYNCTWVIVAFRLLTIALFSLILVRARRHRIAEAAAFFCLAIMTWLMLRWMAYSEHSAELTNMMAVLAEHPLPEYVVFANEP
jgi:hypothetical protein